MNELNHCPNCNWYIASRPELHPYRVYVDDRGFTHHECRMISAANYVSEDDLEYVRQSILGSETT